MSKKWQGAMDYQLQLDILKRRRMYMYRQASVRGKLWQFNSNALPAYTRSCRQVSRILSKYRNLYSQVYQYGPGPGLTWGVDVKGYEPTAGVPGLYTISEKDEDLLPGNVHKKKRKLKMDGERKQSHAPGTGGPASRTAADKPYGSAPDVAAASSYKTEDGGENDPSNKSWDAGLNQLWRTSLSQLRNTWTQEQDADQGEVTSFRLSRGAGSPVDLRDRESRREAECFTEDTNKQSSPSLQPFKHVENTTGTPREEIISAFHVDSMEKEDEMREADVHHISDASLYGVHTEDEIGATKYYSSGGVTESFSDERPLVTSTPKDVRPELPLMTSTPQNSQDHIEPFFCGDCEMTGVEGSSVGSRRTSDASASNIPENTHHKHRPMHAKVQRRLSHDFASELEHALKKYTPVLAAEPELGDDRQALETEESYSEAGIPSVDFVTGISNASLSDFPDRSTHRNRPTNRRVPQSGNHESETGHNFGVEDGMPSTENECKLPSTPPSSSADVHDGSASLAVGDDHAGHSNVEGCTEVDAGHATGSNVTDGHSPHTDTKHKHRPTHGRMQRRMSLCGFKPTPDDLSPIQDHGSEGGSEVGSEAPCNEDSLLRNESNVKFSDTVTVSTFSRNSESVLTATMLNDGTSEKTVASVPEDTSPLSDADVGASPVVVSCVRRESAGQVISRPADIRKKQRKQAEVYLHQDKSSTPTSSGQETKSPSISQETAEVTSTSNGYGSADFTDPTTLLEQFRDPDDEKNSHHNLMDIDYTTPSQLLATCHDGEVADAQAKDMEIEETMAPTSSELFQKRLDREITENNPKSLGYEELDHTTPSELLMKREEDAESLYPTSSKLFARRAMTENNRPTNRRVPQSGNHESETGHNFGVQDGMPSKENESKLPSIPPSSSADVHDGSASLAVGDDHAGHSNVEGCTEVDAGHATGSNVTDGHSPHTDTKHKHRPTHGRMQRRMSLCGFKPTPDDLSPIHDHGSEGGSEAPYNEDSLLRNESNVKFSDTVTVSTFSRNSESVLTATVLNDGTSEKNVASVPEDTSPLSDADVGASPVVVSCVRRESAGQVISRPADIIRKKQRKQAEVYLHQDKSSTPTSSGQETKSPSISQETAEVTSTSNGYGSADFTDPTGLLEQFRDPDDEKNSHHHLMDIDYTTPSQLLATCHDGEVADAQAKDMEIEETMAPTSSELFQKRLDRAITENNPKSPGYEELDHTTPSELLMKREEDAESLYTTSSKLFARRAMTENNRPTNRRVLQSGNHESETGHKFGVQDGMPSKEDESKLPSTPPSSSADVHDESASLAVGDDHARHSNVEGCTEVDAGHATGSNVTDGHSPHTDTKHKHRPTHGRMQRRMSLCGFKPTPDDLSPIQDRGSEGGSEAPCNEDSLLRNESNVKFSDTVTVSTFSRNSESVLTAAVLNDGTSEKSVASVPEDTSPLSDADVGASPVVVSCVRRESAGQVISRPADIIRKNQRKQAEIYLHQDKSSTPTSSGQETKSPSISQETAEVTSTSNGYGSADFTDPTALLEQFRDPDDEKNSHHNLMDIDYTMPSQLLVTCHDGEVADVQAKDMEIEETMAPTSSELFQKRLDREITENNPKSPGYEELDHTTPSELLMKLKEEDAESLYPTSSKLFAKRAMTENNSKSKGSELLDQTPPSRLLDEANLPQEDEGITDKYPTSSALFWKKVSKLPDTKSKSAEEKGEGCTIEGDLDLYTTPSKLLRKVLDREVTDAQPNSPGYAELDHTTPSTLFKMREERDSMEDSTKSTKGRQNRHTTQSTVTAEKKDSQGTTDYATPSQLLTKVEARDSNIRHGKDSAVLRSEDTDDSSCWMLPTPSSITADLLNADPASPGSIGQLCNEEKTGMSGKSQKQQDNFCDWRTYSDITNYYMELSEYVAKLANKMRVKSEPHFIGIPSDMSAAEKVKESYTSSTSDMECNEEIVVFGPTENGQAGEDDHSRLRKGNTGNQQSSDTSTATTDSAGSVTVQSEIYDADNEFMWDSHATFGAGTMSVSTAYPSSSQDDADVVPLCAKVSYNTGFTECSDSSSTSDDEYQAGSSTDTENQKIGIPQKTLPELDNKTISEVLWSLYLTSPEARREMNMSLASLMSLYMASQASSSSVFDFCTDSASSVASKETPVSTNHKHQQAISRKGRSHVPTKHASRLPRPQARGREAGRYEGTTPKKRNLPNTRSATPDGRGMMMEKEMIESQNRKLQMEISTLQMENKLLKDKYNRAASKVTSLEEQLGESREQLEALHGNLNQELSQVQRRNKSQAVEERDQIQAQIVSLTKENQSLKDEVSSIEKELEFAHRSTDRALLNSEKNRTLDAHRMEITTLKDEVNRVKSLLEQSERHLQEEETRNKETSQQVIKLTEMKNLLQQQIEMGGGGATATDKQIKSLEKRLRVTEERFHLERADRANNLSQVEDKLLTENARLQAAEKELSRQLHREKDKNRNLENKIKDTREDNERLRLSLPFDEAALISQKAGYDIPYSVHATQRQETVKADYRHIVSQLDVEAGLKAGQEKDMICQLWNTRQQTYQQLRQLEITLQALNLRDNNVAEGLKNLREVKSHADTQLKQLQERLEDAQSEKEICEATYKEQLAMLVNERHDAFARLKTAEDLMEAIKSENEILKSSLAAGGAANLGTSMTFTTNGRVEALQTQVKDLEGQILQMTRSTHLLEAELATLRVQLEARDKALEDAQSEIDLAHSRLTGDGSEDRKQEKIDKLTTQINGHQSEIKLLGDKVSSLNAEKSGLERELEVALREINMTKARVKESRQGEMADSKQAEILREELEERDQRLGKITQEYDAMESELQQTRQDLYAEQIQAQDYEAQMESVQHQMEQRGQILDTLSGTEKEQLAQFQILKETLDSVSQELNQKCAMLKVLQLEMSKEKDRTEYMEKELTTLRSDHPRDEDRSGETSLPSHLLQIRELETERDQLKSELIDITEALKQATGENGDLDKVMKRVEQELMEEKAAHLQTNAERGELEQHLEEIAEEHDALSQERDQSEEDIVKMENDLKDVVHKLEMEARTNHENFASKYPHVPAEAVKMAGELESLRSLMDSKHKEMEMLKDKINRQQVEMDFLNRRVELLHNENQCNREDIARLTSEVSAKIKEGVATREMNQFLVKERARLQKDNTQLGTAVEKEKGIKERRRAEIADVMRKVEKTEESTKTTSREVLQKDAIIASLGSELNETKQSLHLLETDKVQLLGQVEHLQRSVEDKTAQTSTLESRLDTERAKLEDEKSEAAQKRDELMSTCHELERLRHDHGLLLNNLNDEKQSMENLKESLDVQQQCCTKLQEQVSTLTLELESTNDHLATSRDTIDGLKQDKGAIYQEYETMIRRLSEKDHKIAELQNKCDRTEQQMQKELTLQKHNLERENTSTERDLDATREENSVLKEEVKQKEAQLSSFGRTLKELEDVTKEKVEKENQLKHMETTAGDCDLLTQSLRKETMTLQETIARQQESLSALQMEHTTLRDKMRIQEEKLTDQVIVLEKTSVDARNQYDGEKSYLKDTLAQTQNRVASVESSLASAIDSRDKLQISTRMQERSLEETKERLQGEITCRKVAEQRAESLQSQLHESRKDRFLSEEKMNTITISQSRMEKELKVEKERGKRFSDHQQELEATVYTQDSTAKAKQDQIDLLQEFGVEADIIDQAPLPLNRSEVGKLRQILESQKQQLNAKLKKTTTELKQHIEIIEEDRTKLVQQTQLLSTDVEKARDQLAMKNKENLRLQETILGQEDELRQHTLQIRRAEESRKAEEHLQSQLSSKFAAQEEELVRMKVYLSKKAEEAGENDKSMWTDLNRLIQDMNRQLHDHMESQKAGIPDAAKDEKQLGKYRKRMSDLESELSTEKAVHQITKSSLQALEEDNQRLRHQYHAMRRRDNVTSDKKYKSRMEAINAIIARSQTQAQAMLAASGYYDDPLKSLASPRMDYKGSPDNSIASDLSFNSTSPMVIPPYIESSPPAKTTFKGIRSSKK